MAAKFFFCKGLYDKSKLPPFVGIKYWASEIPIPVKGNFFFSSLEDTVKAINDYMKPIVATEEFEWEVNKPFDFEVSTINYYLVIRMFDDGDTHS